MKKLFDVSAQTRSYTDEVIVHAEVVAENEGEAKAIFQEKLFHSGKLYDFLTASKSPNVPTEVTLVFRRLDQNYLNYY
jgi:hypothetical protein